MFRDLGKAGKNARKVGGNKKWVEKSQKYGLFRSVVIMSDHA